MLIVTLTQNIPSLTVQDASMQLREVRPLGNAARQASSMAADVEPEQAEQSAPRHRQQAATAAAAPAGFKDETEAEERWRQPSASDTPPEVRAEVNEEQSSCGAWSPVSRYVFSAGRCWASGASRDVVPCTLVPPCMIHARTPSCTVVSAAYRGHRRQRMADNTAALRIFFKNRA